MQPSRFNPFPILTTERLILRKIASSDDEAIFLLRSDTDLNKYIARTLMTDPTEALAWITHINTSVDKGENVNWAITLKDTGAFAGLICLWNFSDDTTVAETGYQLLATHHGQGIMAEALHGVINYGFDIINLKSIEAFTHKNNAASIKLLEKQNFTHHKTRIDEGFPHNAIFILQNKKDRP